MKLPENICFVDLETTGISAKNHRIIEVGIVRVENGEIVQEYNQLVNPQMYIDPFIESMTGITTESLINAPTFAEIKDDILELLLDSVFVAHNVRFDYGFLRNEFKRYDISFTSPHFCTVKLSRLLFPEWDRHNLDSVISHFDISCINRHRAFDDARVLYEFWNKAQSAVEEGKFLKAVSVVLKKPSLPLSLPEIELASLPDSPGVYIFYGEEDSILYIGKSVNIHDRVLSHFSNDYLTPSDMKISQEIRHIETIKTAGELGALLLESTLIKKHSPIYNRKLRLARKMIILMKVQDVQGYNSVEIKELETILVDDIPQIIGVFKTKKQVKDFLHELAREYHLCPKLLQLDKSSDACFSSQLGYCNGACIKKEIALKYNLRFDEAFYKHKIKPWKFDRPIMIKEKGESDEHHVIDKWCYLGSLKSEHDSLTDLSKEYLFDLDTYKILQSFIFNPKNKDKISLTEFKK
jgi:DNA polymerase-3 subunit epsilon